MPVLLDEARMRTVRTLLLGIYAWGLFVVLDLAFHTVGFQRVHRAVTRLHVRRAPRHVQMTIEMTTTAVACATRWYVRRGPDCLPTALTTAVLLKRQGLPARLCIGVKKYPFAAHAWVVSGDQILDHPPQTYRAYVPISTD